MTQYLVYSDDSSNKFWHICTEGNSYTVNFGKVGTAGQTQTKSFGSAEEAEAAAEKQAAAKMKKGYVPAEPPTGAPAPAKAAAPKAKAAAAKPAAKKAAAAATQGGGPAPVQDDGKPKAWLDEDAEEYFTIEALTNPVEIDAYTKPADNTAGAAATKAFDYAAFGRLCWQTALEEVQAAYQAAVDAGVDNEKLVKGLSYGIDLILDQSLYENGRKNLPWLLEQGGKIPNRLDNPYALHFKQSYEQTGDARKAAESLDAFLDEHYGELAKKYVAALGLVVKAIETGAFDEESGMKRLPTAEEMASCTGFLLYTNEEDYRIGLLTRPESASNSTSWLFEAEYEATKDIHDSVHSQYLPQKLRPLLQSMAEAGSFEGLGLPVVALQERDTGVLLLRRVVNPELAAQQQQEAEALVQKLEATTDFATDAALLEEGVRYLLDGRLEQDLPHASALIGRFLYSLDEDAEDAADSILWRGRFMHPQLNYDYAVWSMANGNFKGAVNIMKDAVAAGVAPAAQKLREFQQVAEERRARNKDTGTKTSRGGKVQFADFAEQNLFLDTENLIARAYESGTIRIRFKIEGEAGYSEALDYVNGLLEKGFARLHRGFALEVRLLAKPQYIKALPSFPKNSCHAFFAAAVQYPALREKVERYADLALVEFDWYLNVHDEDNTVPGTFAACALAFCDESYIRMAGQYARTSDNEHQYIQLKLAAALLKAYGPLPAVAKAIFDISASNGQCKNLGRMPAELYTHPENLTAIVEHVESGLYSARQLQWYVPRYVEEVIGGTTKGNLRKLKALAQGAKGNNKAVFELFYNLYKGYASLEYSEDFGEDLGSATAGKITLPQYKEGLPVVVPYEEFIKNNPNTELLVEYPAKKRAAMFVPHAIDDPVRLEWALKQRESLRKVAKEIPSSYFWTPNVFRIGDWIIDLRSPACAYGAVLYDGTAKSRPYVLYGFLNMAPLFSRFHKRPYKTAEDAESARLASLIEEAPAFQPASAQEEEVSRRFFAISHAVTSRRYYAAGKILPTFQPQDGRFYDAALLQRAELAKALEDPAEQRAMYEELAERRPEFAEFWQEKLNALA